MSYSISLFDRPFLRHALDEKLEDWSRATPLPETALQTVRDRLAREKFLIETDGKVSQEWIHPNPRWGLQVSIFKNQVSFAVPYWDDWENAVMYAESQAKALAKEFGLGYFDAQASESIT